MSTTTVIKSDVANPALASEGKKKIEWAARNMPVLAQIKEQVALILHFAHQIHFQLKMTQQQHWFMNTESQFLQEMLLIAMVTTSI